jgi:glucokinase
MKLIWLSKMALLGIDLGGTKATFAVLGYDGAIHLKDTLLLEKRKGKKVGAMITGRISSLTEKLRNSDRQIESIGISVPGIYHVKTGTVWTPNIQGWEDYPLLREVKTAADGKPVIIDSDRACCILGEKWLGNARSCRDAVFLSVGTGIGAGILVNDEILRGSHDVAGAIGWMALDRPFLEKFRKSGCFEYHASGEGIARLARNYIIEHKEYKGALRGKPLSGITSHDVFSAYEEGDHAAIYVIQTCIDFWGMAVANIVSILNPEKIILGGGIFGPAQKLINSICEEASKWGQPVSMKLVSIESSALSGDAAVYGAGYLALKNLESRTDLS